MGRFEAHIFYRHKNELDETAHMQSHVKVKSTNGYKGKDEDMAKAVAMMEKQSKLYPDTPMLMRYDDTMMFGHTYDMGYWLNGAKIADTYLLSYSPDKWSLMEKFDTFHGVWIKEGYVTTPLMLKSYTRRSDSYLYRVYSGDGQYTYHFEGRYNIDKAEAETITQRTLAAKYARENWMIPEDTQFIPFEARYNHTRDEIGQRYPSYESSLFGERAFKAKTTENLSATLGRIAQSFTYAAQHTSPENAVKFNLVAEAIRMAESAIKVK